MADVKLNDQDKKLCLAALEMMIKSITRTMLRTNPESLILIDAYGKEKDRVVELKKKVQAL